MGNKSFSWFLSLSSKTENRLWHLWDKHWQETVLVFEFFFFIFVFICMSSCQPVFGPPVTPSVLLSKHFLGVVSLVFSQIWHGARNSYKVVHNRAFREKKIFCPKIGKKGPKWAKTRVFSIYWKIWSLIFTEFDLEWKFILLAAFLHKSHTWENFCSWDMVQNVLTQSDCNIF